MFLIKALMLVQILELTTGCLTYFLVGIYYTHSVPNSEQSLMDKAEVSGEYLTCKAYLKCVQADADSLCRPIQEF